MHLIRLSPGKFTEYHRANSFEFFNGHDSCLIGIVTLLNWHSFIPTRARVSSPQLQVGLYALPEVLSISMKYA